MQRIPTRLTLDNAVTILQMHRDGQLPIDDRIHEEQVDLEATMLAICETNEEHYKIRLMDLDLAGIPDGDPNPDSVNIELGLTSIRAQVKGNNQKGSFVLEQGENIKAAEFTPKSVYGIAMTPTDGGVRVETLELDRHRTGQVGAYIFANE